MISMVQEEGRFQLAHHAMAIGLFSQRSTRGYKLHETKPNGTTIWVSEKPTHLYDHQTEEADSVDGMVVYFDERLALKPVGPRYRSLEELKASLQS